MSRLFLVALRRRFVVWLVAATLLAFGTPLGGPALAQSDRAAGSAGSADAVTPVEEFSKQVEEFKKSYPDLNKKIEESAKSIDAITDVETARKEIEELRGAVAGPCSVAGPATSGPVLPARRQGAGACILAHEDQTLSQW